MLENPEFPPHKKLCIRLKRAEKKVLQNALKHAAATRSKIKDSYEERDLDCDDQNTNGHNDKSCTEENTSNMVDATISAVDQLCVQ